MLNCPVSPHFSLPCPCRLTSDGDAAFLVFEKGLDTLAL
jgi:hypothetical protein